MADACPKPRRTPDELSRTAGPDGAAGQEKVIRPQRRKKTKPAGAATTFGDGQWLVGRDIRAGTYRTAGPEDNGLGLCYRERDKDASGEFNSIIANDNPTGPANLTVSDGEYVKSTGCRTWHLTS